MQVEYGFKGGSLQYVGFGGEKESAFMCANFFNHCKKRINIRIQCENIVVGDVDPDSAKRRGFRSRIKTQCTLWNVKNSFRILIGLYPYDF